MVKPRPRRICRKFKKCCVYTCLNSTVVKPRLQYFKLPTDLKIRAETLRLILRDDLLDKPLTNPYYICKRHYSRKDIENNKLASTALPGYNLPTKNIAVQTQELRYVDNATQTGGTFKIKDVNKMNSPRSFFVSHKTLREPKNEATSTTLKLKRKDKTKQKDKSKRRKKEKGDQATSATKDTTACTNDTKESIEIIKEENIEVANKDSNGTFNIAKDQAIATDSIDIADKIKKEILEEDDTTIAHPNRTRRVRRHSKYLRYVIDKEIVIDMPNENDNGVPFDDPTNIVDVNNPKNIVISKDVFFRICENLLTKDLCELVKAQIEVKMNECGTTSNVYSDYQYSQDYLKFCKSILNMSSKTYSLLQISLRLPRPALIKRLLH